MTITRILPLVACGLALGLSPSFAATPAATPAPAATQAPAATHAPAAMHAPAAKHTPAVKHTRATTHARATTHHARRARLETSVSTTYTTALNAFMANGWRNATDLHYADGAVTANAVNAQGHSQQVTYNVGARSVTAK